MKTKTNRLTERSRYHVSPKQRGDVLAFDRTFDGNRLRVRELFSVINEQTKMNATDNVVVADFSRANALAA